MCVYCICDCLSLSQHDAVVVMLLVLLFLSGDFIFFIYFFFPSGRVTGQSRRMEQWRVEIRGHDLEGSGRHIAGSQLELSHCPVGLDTV